MLLISVPMTALFAAAFLSYFVFRPGTVSEAPPIDDMEGPMGGNWDNSDGSWSTPGSPSSQNREEPSIVKPPKEEDLNNQPPHIQRAMRANVRLIVANRMLGSGVVVEMKDTVAQILTNRHVIDQAFAESDGTRETPLDSLSTVDVTYVTGDKEPGKVIWVAPDGIDLAVVRAVCSAEGVVAATWSDSASVGEDVFAVGNPAGLGWSLTKGTVSALRSHETKNKKATIPVIQTDAPITHGNSGGGLYNGQGELIGINNFIIDPRLANNAGFAIRFSLLNKWNDVPFNVSGQPQSEEEMPEATSTGG
jgi:S1-C subfamily serine protease